MKVIIVGGFIETIELCENNEMTIVGIIDKEKCIYNYPYLGTDDDAKEIFKIYKDCKIIVSPDSSLLRRKLVNYYESIGFEIYSVISKEAKISKYAFIDSAVLIQSNTYISANVKVGKGVRINVNANVMHDSSVGDFTTVAPNAVILGRVTIGQNCYIGSNSTILPNIVIGDNCIIGAGAVVTKNVENHQTVKGVPAK